MQFGKLVVSATLIAGVAAANATMWNLDASLDGSQEVPGSGSPGTGMFMGTYDDVTNNLVVLMYHVDGLVGTFTATHIHEAAPGTNGPVRINFPSFGTVTSMGGGSYMYTQTSPIVINPATLPTLEASLLAGNTYVNFHTTTNPGGEVRGRIIATAVPEPATMAALSLGAIALIRRRRAA